MKTGDKTINRKKLLVPGSGIVLSRVEESQIREGTWRTSGEYNVVFLNLGGVYTGIAL